MVSELLSSALNLPLSRLHQRHHTLMSGSSHSHICHTCSASHTHRHPLACAWDATCFQLSPALWPSALSVISVVNYISNVTAAVDWIRVARGGKGGGGDPNSDPTANCNRSLTTNNNKQRWTTKLYVCKVKRRSSPTAAATTCFLTADFFFISLCWNWTSIQELTSWDKLWHKQYPVLDGVWYQVDQHEESANKF